MDFSRYHTGYDVQQPVPVAPPKQKEIRVFIHPKGSLVAQIYVMDACPIDVAHRECLKGLRGQTQRILIEVPRHE